MTTKHCSKCGEVKDFAGFNKSKAAKDGLTYFCKVCNAKAANTWYSENKERAKTTATAWVKSQPADVHKNYYAAWYQRNKEALLAKKEARLRMNPEKARTWSKVWCESNREAASIPRKTRIKQLNFAWAKANSGHLVAKRVQHREQLSDGYVAGTLRIPLANISPELLELKREQLTIYRLSRELKQAIKLNKETT